MKHERRVIMVRWLPNRSAMENLKWWAKTLLKAHKSGDPACCDNFRILRHFLDASDDDILSASIGLKECLEVVALNLGFRNWKSLTEHPDIARQVHMGLR